MKRADTDTPGAKTARSTLLGENAARAASVTAPAASLGGRHGLSERPAGRRCRPPPCHRVLRRARRGPCRLRRLDVRLPGLEPLARLDSVRAGVCRLRPGEGPAGARNAGLVRALASLLPERAVHRDRPAPLAGQLLRRSLVRRADLFGLRLDRPAPRAHVAVPHAVGRPASCRGDRELDRRASRNDLRELRDLPGPVRPVEQLGHLLAAWRAPPQRVGDPRRPDAEDGGVHGSLHGLSDVHVPCPRPTSSRRASGPGTSPLP